MGQDKFQKKKLLFYLRETDWSGRSANIFCVIPQQQQATFLCFAFWEVFLPFLPPLLPKSRRRRRQILRELAPMQQGRKGVWKKKGELEHGGRSQISKEKFFNPELGCCCRSGIALAVIKFKLWRGTDMVCILDFFLPFLGIPPNAVSIA